ncbi:MAG: ferritin [Deltaproteobacteria bacterium]|jgi:ferritin|nr:ferritin [Deltaproteobacteria bacterium]
MLNDALTNSLNDQVNAEYYSAYLYLTMSAYADRAGFKGAANWLFVQAKEEMAHGTHMYQHILERGADPAFADIKAPKASFKDLRDVFEQVLAHEQRVTERINSIASVALRENDHASYNFILWYVNEQIEEEATITDLLAKMSLAAGNPSLLYTLDAELGTRVFVDPFPQTQA